MSSSLLNWPDGIERTPAGERTNCSKFDTSLRRTRSDLKDEMSRMDVDEWRVEEVGGSSGDPGVVVRWRDDDDEYAAACDAYTTKTANLRASYLWIHETRMREKRPVATAADSFAAARLPSGEDGDGEAVVGQMPDHEILGVSPQASDAAIEDAYRERASETHPDSGGNAAEFKRVKAAYERLVGGD